MRKRVWLGTVPDEEYYGLELFPTNGEFPSKLKSRARVNYISVICAYSLSLPHLNKGNVGHGKVISVDNRAEFQKQINNNNNKKTREKQIKSKQREEKETRRESKELTAD